jgi:hypothetical protein
MEIINQQQVSVSAAGQQAAASQVGPKQFNADEIAELTIIRESYEQLTLSLGQLQMQKREMEKNEKKVNEKLLSTENQEKVFLDKILAKYGEGTFDINTGVFTPKK